MQETTLLMTGQETMEGLVGPNSRDWASGGPGFDINTRAQRALSVQNRVLSLDYGTSSSGAIFFFTFLTNSKRL